MIGFNCARRATTASSWGLREHRNRHRIPLLPPTPPNGFGSSRGDGGVVLNCANLLTLPPWTRQDASLPMRGPSSSATRSTSSRKGVARSFFTARIERAQLYRARSASKEAARAPLLSYPHTLFNTSRYASSIFPKSFRNRSLSIDSFVV